MILTRDQILAAPDLTRELVKVPEWGGDVYVRSMTGAERDAWEVSMLSSKSGDTQRNYENLRGRLVALTVVDEEGNRVFTFEDAAALGKKSAKALDRVFGVAQRLNGMTQSDVQDLAKNSDAEASEDSTSA